MRDPLSPTVASWETDYDIMSPEYVADPFRVWDELRRSCPVASTTRWGGSWLPTRYADVAAIAHDVEHFSSRDVGVFTSDQSQISKLAPISVDPPAHTWTRRLLLPWFSHTRVAGYESFTRGLCNELLDEIVGAGAAEAATDYAQQIPVRVIALVLGVPEDLSETFVGWVRDVLEFAHDPVRSASGGRSLFGYLAGTIDERRGSNGPT